MPKTLTLGAATSQPGTIQYDRWEALSHPTGHAEFLPVAEQMMKDKVESIYQAAKDAGHSLVEKDEISSELEDKVAEELMPLETFVNGANEYFKSEMQEAGVA